MLITQAIRQLFEKRYISFAQHYRMCHYFQINILKNQPLEIQSRSTSLPLNQLGHNYCYKEKPYPSSNSRQTSKANIIIASIVYKSFSFDIEFTYRVSTAHKFQFIYPC